MSEILPLPTGGGYALISGQWSRNPIAEILPLPTGGGYALIVGSPRNKSHWSVGISMSRDGWSAS